MEQHHPYHEAGAFHADQIATGHAHVVKKIYAVWEECVPIFLIFCVVMSLASRGTMIRELLGESAMANNDRSAHIH